MSSVPQEIIVKFSSSLLLRYYQETWLTASELQTIWRQAKYLARKQKIRGRRKPLANQYWAAVYRIAENLAKKKLGNLNLGRYSNTS